MKCIDMCFLATVGSCVVGLLANSGVHTWEICCCQLCARHPWLSFPHSPSKFCQALRLAFHAPLISIGLRSKRPLVCEKIVADRVVRVKREARAFSQRRIGATESSEASARSNLHQLQMLLTLRCIDSFKKGAVPVS